MVKDRHQAQGTIPLTVELPPDLYGRLQFMKGITGWTIKEMIVSALARWLDRHEKRLGREEILSGRTVAPGDTPLPGGPEQAPAALAGSTAPVDSGDAGDDVLRAIRQLNPRSLDRLKDRLVQRSTGVGGSEHKVSKYLAVVDIARRGKTIAEIAVELGEARTTIRRWLQKISRHLK
jgi:hypothetical protein